MPPTQSVIIVGGGPVGVGLAIDLGRRGIACTVVEKRTELSGIPKGQGLSQRTLETCWFWGVEERLRAARVMPAEYPIGQVTVYEHLLGEFWHASPDRSVVQGYYFRPNERLPQYRTEAVFRERLAEFPNVTSYFGWEATTVEDADGVRVRIEREGQHRVLTGAYVVGCDGGQSMVREHCDLERSGTDWGELVSLIVFRSKELHEALERFPPRSTYRVMHPDLHGYWMFFGRVDVGEEFFFHAPVPADQTAETFDPWELLHRAAGFAFQGEIDHVGFWDMRVQVANRYRRGRAFIGGDAAHTHPPYGGFGLNNGLEDAVNLGWKLAAVLDGWGGEALLDSYSEERQAVFRDVGEDIIGGWIRDDRAMLERYRPEDDRPEFEAKFADMTQEFGRRLRRFEPNYEGSSVVFGPPGGVCSAHGKHGFDARAGHHLPPRDLSSGRSVYESLGLGFTLLAFDATDEDVARFAERAAEHSVPLDIVRDTYAEQRRDYGVPLVLVRPDQFVAWTGEHAPADLDGLFSRVCGTARTTRGTAALP